MSRPPMQAENLRKLREEVVPTILPKDYAHNSWAVEADGYGGLSPMCLVGHAIASGKFTDHTSGPLGPWNIDAYFGPTAEERVFLRPEHDGCLSSVTLPEAVSLLDAYIASGA